MRSSSRCSISSAGASGRIDRRTSLAYSLVWKRGLEEAGKDHRVVLPDGRGVVLVPNERSSWNLPVLIPPGLLAARARKLEQLGTPHLGDLVDIQQLADIAGTDSHLGRLDPGDRRGGQLELLSHLLDGQSGALAKSSQDPCQPALLHR
jgi:hypothetical protein